MTRTPKSSPTFPQLALALLGAWSLLIAVLVGIYVVVPLAVDYFVGEEPRCCACRLEPGNGVPCVGADDAVVRF